jgi:hypothetical protein
LGPFYYLLLAHLIADYPLQSDFLANMKAKLKFILLTHAAIWALVVAATLSWLGLYATWKLIFLFLGHAAIDYWKCHFAEKEKALTRALWIDQILHFCQLIIVFRL